MAASPVAPVRLGERWLHSLQTDGVVESTQASRGRGVAARGGVFDLVIEPGAVHASVRMRQSEARRVSVGVARLEAQRWHDIAQLVSTNHAWCAAVVEGRLGEDLFDALLAAGIDVSLDSRTTSVDCSCERPGTLCEHAAAVCHRLAELLDGDPYLVATLRGGDRSAFVTSVTSARLDLTAPDRPGSDRPGFDRPGAAPSLLDTTLFGAGAPDPGALDTDVVSPIAARGPAEALDALTVWRRKPAPLPPAPRARRQSGSARAAVQAPPAELGVDANGLAALSSDAIERAAALRRALEIGDRLGAHAAGSLDGDRDGDVIRRCVAGALPSSTAAALLHLDVETLDRVVAHWDGLGAEAFSLLGRPRRLEPGEVDAVVAAVAGRVRTRSTGALLDDGRQVRRSERGTWAVTEPLGDGSWRVVSSGLDLDEVLDAADVEVSDPDR